MKFFQRAVHATSVGVAVALLGAVVYYLLSFIGLGGGANANRFVSLLLSALPFIQLAVVALGVWKRVSYKAVLPVVAGCGVIVAFLVADDSARPPLIDVGAVVMASDAPSYATYRWILKDDPQNRLAEMPKQLETMPASFGEKESQSEFYAKYRTVVTKAWEQALVGREWIDRMASHKPSGIYPLSESLSAPILSFGHILDLSKTYLGYANLLVLDGRDEEAAGMLVNYFRASYHLQRGGIALIPQMTAQAMLKKAYALLEGLVARGRLSSGMRAELASALKEAPVPAELFRRIFLGEQVMLRQVIDQVRARAADDKNLNAPENTHRRQALELLGRLIFNPHRCERECVEHCREVLRAAEQRDWKSSDQAHDRFEAEIDRFHFKNPVGWQVKAIAGPAVNKVSITIWETEDRRLALLKQLEGS